MRLNDSRRWMTTAVWVSMVLAAVAGPWREGDKLPALAGKDLEGALPKTAGKVVLIDFWASWCGPCKASFPVLDQLQKEFGSRGLIVLGINVDKEPAAMQQFLKDHPVSFTVVQDKHQKLVEEAAIEGMPTSFMVDRAGKIRFVHRGFVGDKTEKEMRAHLEVLLAEGVKP
jgi:thiol-disulfide isomerase/thioredoxin